MGREEQDIERRASTIERLWAALNAGARRNVPRASKILIYGTILAAISQIASSDAAVVAALPTSIAQLVTGLSGVLQASPALSGFVGSIGGDLTAGVIERVAGNDDLTAEDIADLIAEMLANSESRAALHRAANDVLNNEQFRSELQQIVGQAVADSGVLKTRAFVETV
jgi:hypothetical protein